MMNRYRALMLLSLSNKFINTFGGLSTQIFNKAREKEVEWLRDIPVDNEEGKIDFGRNRNIKHLNLNKKRDMWRTNLKDSK